MTTLISSLAIRDRRPEIMDQPGLAVVPHHEALRGLERINWISASDWILWRSIRALAEERRGMPVRVLDIATGGGDVPLRLHERARRAGLPITFAGADISPVAIDYARQQAWRRDAGVEFFRLDALSGPIPTDYDVITTSLFLHHLEGDQAIDFLHRLSQAARALVLVNDLIRSRVGYVAAWLGTRILSSSYVVHADGAQSVRAAFTMAEAMTLAHQAGLQDASIEWRWPWRFLLRWRRPGGLP